MQLVISKTHTEPKIILEPRHTNFNSKHDIVRLNPCIKQNVNDLSFNIYQVTYDSYLMSMFTQLVKNMQTINSEKYQVKIDKNKLYQDFTKFIYTYSRNKNKSFYFLK